MRAERRRRKQKRTKRAQRRKPVMELAMAMPAMLPLAGLLAMVAGSVGDTLLELAALSVGAADRETVGELRLLDELVDVAPEAAPVVIEVELAVTELDRLLDPPMMVKAGEKL